MALLDDVHFRRPQRWSVPRQALPCGKLKPVVEHIEAGLCEALTPLGMAKVGNMSVRTLHETFKSAFGISPMEYVRRERLGLVRIELIRNRDPQLRVTDLAIRYGFFHLGRFAQQYRERYGEHHP